MNQRLFQPLPPSAFPAEPDEDVVLDFGQILSILRHGWWIIGGAGLAGALLAAAMLLRIQPTHSVNAAPLVPVPDAAPMVKTADHVVLMLRYGTPEHEVQAGVDTLGRLAMPQVSIVLSMAPRRLAQSHDRREVA